MISLKRIIAGLFALLMLALTGCGGGHGSDHTDSGPLDSHHTYDDTSGSNKPSSDTDANTDKTNDTISMHTPEAGIISSENIYGGVVYYALNSRLVYSMPYETDTFYPACIRPLCLHRNGECPAYAETTQYTLCVPQSGTPMPLVYMFARRPAFEYRDGVYIETPEAVKNLGRTYVYNTATGESRVLADTEFSQVHGAWYHDGKIYLAVEYLNTFSAVRIGMMDADNGKYTELDFETSVVGIGITNGRFYFITTRGVVYSCDLSLSDIREEYDCGTSLYRTHKFTITAYVDSGMLYYEKKCRIPSKLSRFEMKDMFMVSDVYAVELSDKEAGASLVAENVREFIPYGGDLYYTVFEYDDRGTYACDDGNVRKMLVTDGGTLYQYNRETKTSTVCFSDCGTNFASLLDIDGEYILFDGFAYSDPGSYNTETPLNIEYFHNAYCLVNIRTGEWRVLWHTYDDAGIFE